MKVWIAHLRQIYGIPKRYYRVKKQYYGVFGLKVGDAWRFYSQDIFEYWDSDDEGNRTNNNVLRTSTVPKKIFPK